MLRYLSVLLIATAFSFGITLSLSKNVLRAQDTDKPAIAPQPRTINLTQEQRFIIKEKATLPKYDEMLAQQDKLSVNNTRPSSSVVRTIGEYIGGAPPAATQQQQ